MKRLFFAPSVVLFWVGCFCTGAGYAQMKESDKETISAYDKGKASTGEEYFFGVQNHVVMIDVKLREVELMDGADVKPEEFEEHYKTMLAMIKTCKKSMKPYEGKGWPKQEKLQALTIEWVDAVGGLIENYLKPLAMPMSIPDDQWKEADINFYDKYILAYESYLEVDGRWVDFQYEFAAANNFELSDETIDMDQLIEEDLDK